MYSNILFMSPVSVSRLGKKECSRCIRILIYTEYPHKKSPVFVDKKTIIPVYFPVNPCSVPFLYHLN